MAAIPRRVHKIEPNKPCWCGSGSKAKYCHGRETLPAAVDEFDDSPSKIALTSPNVWVAFCDDTRLQRDIGPVAEGTKTWTAVLVSPSTKVRFIQRMREVAQEYRAKWGVSELHWAEIIRDPKMRPGSDRSKEVVALATAFADALDEADAVLLSASADPSVPHIDVPLRSGDRVDDFAFHYMLLWLERWFLKNRSLPTERVLVMADLRGGSQMSEPQRAVNPSHFPHFAGGSVFFGVKWPEMDIADFAAYSYFRMVHDASQGETGARIGELYEIFQRVNERRRSPQMALFDVDVDGQPRPGKRPIELSNARTVNFAESAGIDYLAPRSLQTPPDPAAEGTSTQ